MECGRIINGLRWSGYSFALTDSNTPSVSIEDCGSEEQSAAYDNYLITYPEDDGDSASINKDLNESSKLDHYVNPVFISDEVLKGEISEDADVEELMKNEAKKFEDYKFCEAVNDFDIELESGEAIPIVYLSTTRAAKLQRALRLAGLKKRVHLEVLLPPPSVSRPTKLNDRWN
ncbi:jg8459 [Pararge aegeria aegeria]|uniref:Jg8459 protein n=1 Tax=Pararge aegeria aegeria TaxID=348720 RepID=A0A8S4RZE4_9NEOP|nr:jg8459 [Pararge aegeria aegeria]